LFVEVIPWPQKSAVLPFDSMSGNPKQEYFYDGITEQIITVYDLAVGIKTR